MFAVDDDTMESEVLRLCEERGWSLGVAESLTGGFIGARIANVPGASRTFRGSIASYATDVKRAVLGVTADLVVSEEAVKQMAEGAQRVLGADVAIAVTGVAGPDEQDGQPVGTVWYGIAIPGHEPEAVTARLPFDRERIRQFSTITLLNTLRMRLLSLGMIGLRRAFLAVVPPPSVRAGQHLQQNLRPRSRRPARGPAPSSVTSRSASSAPSTTPPALPNSLPMLSDRAALHPRTRWWGSVPGPAARVGAVARSAPGEREPSARWPQASPIQKIARSAPTSRSLEQTNRAICVRSLPRSTCAVRVTSGPSTRSCCSTATARRTPNRHGSRSAQRPDAGSQEKLARESFDEALRRG